MLNRQAAMAQAHTVLPGSLAWVGEVQEVSEGERQREGGVKGDLSEA